MIRVILRTSLVLFCCILLLPMVGYTQIGDPGGGEDPGVPLSGIEWLLAAGGILGAKKVLQRFKKH
jgi:hypothetical protein